MLRIKRKRWRKMARERVDKAGNELLCSSREKKEGGEEGKKANDRYIRNIVSDTRAIFSNELFESIIRRKI